MSTPKLTDEQRQAVQVHPGDVTRVEDDRWLREQLQIGFDEADRGEVAEWDVEAFLAKMYA